MPGHSIADAGGRSLNLFGPGSPNSIYFGTDRLHRWTEPGVNHTIVSQAPIASDSQGSPIPISAIGISPQSDGVRIVGLDNGQVWATASGSSTLANVTGTIPAKYIARTVIDPNNTNTAYVTLSGYFGNSTSHIYKTTNLNIAIPTWTGLDGGQIPDVPVNAFVIDPQNSNTLYAGTDIGVYRSVDGGATWIKVNQIPPPVAGAGGPGDRKVAFNSAGSIFTVELGVTSDLFDFVFRQTGPPKQLRFGRRSRGARTWNQEADFFRIVQPGLEQRAVPVCSIPQSFRSRHSWYCGSYSDLVG